MRVIEVSNFRKQCRPGENRTPAFTRRRLAAAVATAATAVLITVAGIPSPAAAAYPRPGFPAPGAPSRTISNAVVVVQMRTWNFTDYLLTTNPDEATSLRSTGLWLTDNDSPEILFYNSKAGDANFVAVHRAIRTDNGRHLPSLDPAAETFPVRSEQVVGYLARSAAVVTANSAVLGPGPSDCSITPVARHRIYDPRSGSRFLGGSTPYPFEVDEGLLGWAPTLSCLESDPLVE